MIGIACDHAALNFKTEIIKHLKSLNYEIKDFGAFNSEAVDYPDYAFKVAESVVNNECILGIVICGTGIGMSIAANKIKGVRCALCGDTFSARAAREHNNANILALGERVLGLGLALDIVEIFIKTEFSNIQRHKTRIDKISSIERK